jgi:hypothetical protein
MKMVSAYPAVDGVERRVQRSGGIILSERAKAVNGGSRIASKNP